MRETEVLICRWCGSPFVHVPCPAHCPIHKVHEHWRCPRRCASDGQVGYIGMTPEEEEASGDTSQYDATIR